MNEELHSLRPGDCFLVDYNGREDQMINRRYREYQGLWLTVCKVFDEEDDYTEYYAVYNRKNNGGRKLSRTLGNRLQGMVWMPIDDFHEFKRYDQVKRPPAPRQGLPDI